jgi:hypothetical protein
MTRDELVRALFDITRARERRVDIYFVIVTADPNNPRNGQRIYVGSFLAPTHTEEESS